MLLRTRGVVLWSEWALSSGSLLSLESVEDVQRTAAL